MLPKQNNYSVGIYMRLSKDDERAGESLSIENQRAILTEYVSQQGWTVYNEYVDDGISGVTFERPALQRMLDDAKAGRINLIICKDLSRFGRNYIMVGQYTDYIFPMYGIRFIALNDNVDTANSQSAGMDMMPIMNIFNEWHCANTSQKIKAVFASNAKAGKYKSCIPSYGYVKADDEKHTPIIDPESAAVVKRIFELRAKGIGMQRIAKILNEENVLSPYDYYCKRVGKFNARRSVTHLWGKDAVRRILYNPIYIGTLAQQRYTSVSYKNHKTVFKDEEDWVVIENNHEPIISQELWDKVREYDVSVSRGKSDKNGVVSPFSGLLYCADCGFKMKKTQLKTGLTKEQYDTIHNANCNFIIIHNPPGSTRPSGTDILTLWKEQKAESSIVIGHDGTVYSISNINRKIPLDKIYEEAYNRAIADGFPSSLAKIKATDELYNTAAFDFLMR